MEGGVLAENPSLEGVAGLFGMDPLPTMSTTMSSGVFQGLWGVAPAALCGGENLPSDFGDTAVLCYEVRLRPGETRTVTTALAMRQARKRCFIPWRASAATALPCACTPCASNGRTA